MPTNPVFTSQFDGTFTYGKDSALKRNMFATKYPSVDFNWWTLTQPGERLDGAGGIYFDGRLGSIPMTRTEPLGYTTLNGHQVHDWPDVSEAPFIAELDEPTGVKSFAVVSKLAAGPIGIVAPFCLFCPDAGSSTARGLLRFFPHHPNGARFGFVDSVAGTDSTAGVMPGIGKVPADVLSLSMGVIDFATGDYSMSIDGGNTWGDGTLPNWNDLVGASSYNLYMGKGGGGTSYFPGQVPDLMMMTGDVSANATLIADLQEYAASAWGWVNA